MGSGGSALFDLQRDHPVGCKAEAKKVVDEAAVAKKAQDDAAAKEAAVAAAAVKEAEEAQLKRLQVNNIPGIEEVNMFKEDGNVIHFSAPKVQASIAANTYVISGHAENKQLQELLPGIINQLGPDNLMNLKRIAESYNAGAAASGGAAPGDD